MLYLLAENDPDQALAKAYFLIFWIALAGLIGVLAIVGLLLLRRATRRRLRAIEQDKAERRQAQSSGRVDAWSAGAERYVDQDKLPEEVPYDTEPDPEDAEPSADDDPDSTDPPPGWEDSNSEDERDPYGLFDDKPYSEPEDEDDDDDDDGDEDWGGEDDDDGRR